MDNQWICCQILDEQESQTAMQARMFWGAGREGYCDFTPDGIDLLLQGISYLRDVDCLDEKGEFKSFLAGIRAMAYYNLYHVCLTYKAIYNIVLQGYYTECAILLRSVFENLIRIKYLYKQNDIDLLNTAFAGHFGYEGRKFKVTYKTMFDSISLGSYRYYRILCDMAHGSFAAHILKVEKFDRDQQKIYLDRGIVFKPFESSFVINQFCVFLLAHVEFMMLVYPEIKKKMPTFYADKYQKTVSKLWAGMKAFDRQDQAKDWYRVMKQVIIA